MTDMRSDIRQCNRIVISTLLLGVILCSCVLANTSADGVSSADTQSRTIVIPPAVRWFLSLNYPAVESLRSTQYLDHPDYVLLFYAPVVDWRNGRSAAWLIGYCIGRDGNGHVPFNRLAVVEDGRMNDREELQVHLPDDCAGDNAVAFELAKGKWAFAVSRYEGRHVEYDARIFTLEPKPKLLLRYHCEEPFPEKRCWYSTLHFVDIDGDGTREMLADRIVREFERRMQWPEWCIYRYDAKRERFGPPQSISKNEFTRLLERSAAKNGSDRVSIKQEGVPFDPSYFDSPIVPPLAHVPATRPAAKRRAAR